MELRFCFLLKLKWNWKKELFVFLGLVFKKECYFSRGNRGIEMGREDTKVFFREFLWFSFVSRHDEIPSE